MRLAVFTSQFPAKLNTFFSRDMRALLETGFELDIFAVYPLQRQLWQYVPEILGEKVLSRDKVHHIRLGQTLLAARPWPLRKLKLFFRETAAIGLSAVRFGVEPLVKSAYVLPKAWVWAQRNGGTYDHILAYWGNYAGTCAYIYHRLMDRQVPFSIFFHATVDLYQNQVYLKQKLLYADNIFVCSEFNRKFLREHYPDVFRLIAHKVHVSRHGLELAEYPYEPNDRPQHMILAVARLDKAKGFDYLLRAVRELAARGIQAELEIVGDGDEARSLRRLAQDLGIMDRVRFPGWLSVSEVQLAMRRATILAHPSLSEGIPNVLTEAMALGTPIVASAVGGIPELLDDGRCGVLVPPTDSRALADGLETLLKDNGLRQRYAIAGRKRIEENFNLWENGRRMAGLLQSTRRQPWSVLSMDAMSAKHAPS